MSKLDFQKRVIESRIMNTETQQDPNSEMLSTLTENQEIEVLDAIIAIEGNKIFIEFTSNLAGLIVFYVLVIRFNLREDLDIFWLANAAFLGVLARVVSKGISSAIILGPTFRKSLTLKSALNRPTDN